MLSRRSFLRRSGLAVAAGLTVPSVLTATPRAERPAVRGTFTALRRGVGTFTERGGTIGWLATDDVIVVVDTQYPATASNCWTGLQERSPQERALVINTHHHGDHTSGNPTFAPNATQIVAHANAPQLQRQSAQQRGNADQQVYAETTFEESWSTEVGDETVRLQHYGPAHTGGDAVITFEQANVVHMGDLVFNRAYPFIDVRGGASTQNWITTLETVHDAYTDETIFIHGHGNPEYGVTGSRADLLVMRDFLEALNAYVTQQRQAGASLEAMKQKEVLEGFEAFQFDWALSLSRCIEAVYQEQTASEG